MFDCETPRKKCSICGGPIEILHHPDTGVVVWSNGNNAEPVNNGRCCNECNMTVVLKARVSRIPALN